MFRKGIALMLALFLVLGSTIALAEQPTKKITILSIWAEDNDNGIVMTQLTDKYIAEVNPNFSYEYELVSADNLRQKVATMAASNDLPDVFVYESGTPLIPLIEDGYVLDITTALTDLGVYDKLDAGAVAILSNLTDTEHIYDLPLGLNVEGFWYNKALFEKAGITAAPTTYAELQDACDKLFAAGIQPFTAGGADKWPATRLINAYVMRKLGVDALAKCAAGEMSYVNDGIIEGAQLLQDMCNKGYFGEGPTTVDYNTAANMLMSGQAAILYNGSWFTQNLASTDNPAGEDGIGFFNIPTVEGGVGTLTEYSMNCGNILCLSAAKYDEATADWLKYMVSNIGDFAIQNMGTLKGYTIETYPEDLSSYTKMVADEFAKVTAASTWFEATMDSEMTTTAQQNVQSLMNGDMTAQEYAQALQDVYDAAQ